jgi:hypothetical protein
MQKMKTDFLSPSLSIGAGQKLHEKAYHNQPSLSTLSLSLYLAIGATPVSIQIWQNAVSLRTN